MDRKGTPGEPSALYAASFTAHLRVNERAHWYREARNCDLSFVYASYSFLSCIDKMRFMNWFPKRFREEATRDTFTKSVPIP